MTDSYEQIILWSNDYHFGSVEVVITAPEEELIEIPGLGKTKAKKIREVVGKSLF